MAAHAIFPYVPQRGNCASRKSCATIRILSHWVGSWNVQLHRKCHSVTELTERYDARAESWERTLSKFDTADAYRVLLSRALPDAYVVDPDAAPRVLDCGTGTGAFLSAFADATGGKPELHGIDISPAMLQQARARLSERGYDAEFRAGEVTRLPYADGHFDVVLAAHVIEHVPDPEMALAEMHRVLKPGGLVIVCVTRDTLMGRAIQTLWRTHTLDETSAKASLWKMGFRKVRALRALSAGRFDDMSIACVAEKPMDVMESRKFETEADHV